MNKISLRMFIRLFGFSTIFGAVFINIYTFVNICLYNHITYIEPNKGILYLELVMSTIAFIFFFLLFYRELSSIRENQKAYKVNTTNKEQ